MKTVDEYCWQTCPEDMPQGQWMRLCDLFIAPGGRIAQSHLDNNDIKVFGLLVQQELVVTKLFEHDQRGRYHSLHPYYMLTNKARKAFEGMNE